MKEKNKTEFEQGFDKGYREGRRSKFMKPLLAYILFGFLIALSVFFGFGSFTFLVITFANMIYGLTGLFFFVSFTGVAIAASIYVCKHLEDY